MATPTFFEHNEIAAVISDVNPFQNFLLNFFGSEHLSPDEKISFDRISPDKRISVFVNPRKPGEVQKRRGFAVDSYKPGYTKDKDTVDPKHVIRRSAGQAFNTNQSPAERYAAILIDIAAGQLERLNRRLELMSAQLLIGGAYDMTADGETIEVDFVRNSNLTVTKSGGAAWTVANASSVSPIDDIEELMELTSSPIRFLIVGSKAWKAIRRDPKFDKAIYVDLMSRGSTSLNQGPQGMSLDGVIYRGSFSASGIEIYTYTNDYTDPGTGTDTLYVPQDSVIGISDRSHGWQCFGPIQDASAEFMAMPYFYKNWQENDPGIPYIMLQSAPLLAHTKINSTFHIKTNAN
jgi:hypothetical protein